MRVLTALVAASFLVPLSSLRAQEPPPIELGARVRVTHGCRMNYAYVVGTWWRCRKDAGALVAMTEDTVVLQPAGQAQQLDVPLGSVTRFEVSRGQKSRTALGAGIGFFVGGAAGGLLGGLFVASDDDPETGAELSMTGILVGGLSTAVLGGLVGSTIKTDRWEDVSLERFRLSITPQRDGRFALGFGIVF